MDRNIIFAALRFWSPSINAFVFLFGPLSITLKDIFFLTGLPILGDECAIDIDACDPLLPEYHFLPSDKSSYHFLIEKWSTATGVPTQSEHIAFLWTLIGEYIICPSSGKPPREYLHMVRALAVGRPFALGTLLLALAYQSFTRAVIVDKITKAGPYLWLLQIWLLAYFSTFHSKNDWTIKLDRSSFLGPQLMSCNSDLDTDIAFSFFLGQIEQFDFDIWDGSSKSKDLPIWLQHSFLTGNDLLSLRNKLFYAFTTDRFLISGGSLCFTQLNHLTGPSSDEIISSFCRDFLLQQRSLHCSISTTTSSKVQAFLFLWTGVYDSLVTHSFEKMLKGVLASVKPNKK